MSDGRAARAWLQYGKGDPYYAVLNHDAFRSGRMDDGSRAAFFASGAEHVEQVLATIRQHVAPDFVPRRVLDFGSGVGRLLIPFAQRAESAMGVDISPEMNAEAQRNCAALDLDNVGFALSDDALSQVTGTFDLVHSFIVFQHIPPRHGERIMRALLARLEPGGVGALQFTYARVAPRWRKAINRARRHVPFLNAMVNLFQGRAITEPLMGMYEYDLARLLGMLHAHGCEQVHSVLTDHGGHLGALLVFRMPLSGQPAR